MYLGICAIFILPVLLLIALGHPFLHIMILLAVVGLILILSDVLRSLRPGTRSKFFRTSFKNQQSDRSTCKVLGLLQRINSFIFQSADDDELSEELCHIPRRTYPNFAPGISMKCHRISRTSSPNRYNCQSSAHCSRLYTSSPCRAPSPSRCKTTPLCSSHLTSRHTDHASLCACDHAPPSHASPRQQKNDCSHAVEERDGLESRVEQIETVLHKLERALVESNSKSGSFNCRTSPLQINNSHVKWSGSPSIEASAQTDSNRSHPNRLYPSWFSGQEKPREQREVNNNWDEPPSAVFTTCSRSPKRITAKCFTNCSPPTHSASPQDKSSSNNVANEQPSPSKLKYKRESPRRPTFTRSVPRCMYLSNKGKRLDMSSSNSSGDSQNFRCGRSKEKVARSSFSSLKQSSSKHYRSPATRRASTRKSSFRHPSYKSNTPDRWKYPSTEMHGLKRPLSVPSIESKLWSSPEKPIRTRDAARPNYTPLTPRRSFLSETDGSRTSRTSSRTPSEIRTPSYPDFFSENRAPYQSQRRSPRSSLTSWKSSQPSRRPIPVKRRGNSPAALKNEYSSTIGAFSTSLYTPDNPIPTRTFRRHSSPGYDVPAQPVPRHQAVTNLSYGSTERRRSSGSRLSMRRTSNQETDWARDYPRPSLDYRGTESSFIRRPVPMHSLDGRPSSGYSTSPSRIDRYPVAGSPVKNNKKRFSREENWRSPGVESPDDDFWVQMPRRY